MSGGRRIIDSIVQSSTVALFHSYGVAVAPAPDTGRADSTEPPLIGCIKFRAKEFSGRLQLVAPPSVLLRIRSAPLSSHAGRDLIRELTNQLMGRLKNKLLQFQVTLDVGLPSVADARIAEAPSSERVDTKLEYAFRTRQGLVYVLVDGRFDESALSFSVLVTVPGEGEVILF